MATVGSNADVMQIKKSTHITYVNRQIQKALGQLAMEVDFVVGKNKVHQHERVRYTSEKYKHVENLMVASEIADMLKYFVDLHSLL